MQKLFIVYLYLIDFTFIRAQVITFEKTIDVDNGLENPYSILVENDGYVIIGSGTDFLTLNGWRGMKIVKIDLEGNVLWQYVHGWEGKPIFYGSQGSFKKTSDGGYIGGVSMMDTATQKLDAFLIKYNSIGDTVFTERFGGANDDIGYSAIESIDGGYALFGQTKSLGDINGDYYLVKTDSSGNFLWEKTYGSNKLDRGIHITISADGGYMLGGGATITNNFQAYLIKVDSTGNLAWDKSYGGNYTTCGAYINNTIDSGYIFSSCTDSIKSGTDFTYSITKIYSNGNIKWKKIFPHNRYHDILMVREIPSGGYIFCGRVEDEIMLKIVAWIVRLDENGNILWQRRFAHNNEYFTFGLVTSELWDIHPTPDSGFIVLGKSYEDTQDFWVLKLDSLGCINGYCGLTDTNCYYQPWPCVPDTMDSCLTPPCDTVSVNNFHAVIHNLIEIFPNPAFEKINISTTCNTCVFYLYNQLGQAVLTSSLSAEIQTIDVSDLQYGLYLYIARNHVDAMQTGKLIIGR